VFRTTSLFRLVAAAFAVAMLMVGVGASVASASSSLSGFTFAADRVSGAPTGSVALAGAGAFDTAGTFARGVGVFRCTESVGQGPLAGCLAGQGLRWHTETPLASTPFRCSTDALKTGIAGSDTAVFRADFFRAGDGNTPSFSANVIVARHDIAPDVAGVQNVWIQGVGCAGAFVHIGG
jgi:hypothetical protein